MFTAGTDDLKSILGIHLEEEEPDSSALSSELYMYSPGSQSDQADRQTDRVSE